MNNRRFRLSLVASIIATIGVSEKIIANEIAARKFAKNYERPTETPFPKENSYSKARSDLGRTLFFDPRLSASDWISCATCHNPALSWGDGLPKGIGHGMGTLGRRTPTILNLAWGELQFWDGRAASLEEQALGPIEAPGEMNLPHDKMLAKLDKVKPYKALFESAYPGEGITKDTIAKAIATYERTIVSGVAPFDRWVKGDTKALTDAEKRGFVVFNEKAMCSKCHSSWRFTDDGFYDIGVSGDDIGRAKILADIPSMKFAFKTPTLRNVDHRGPYLHNGSEASLEDVVEFYNVGGRATRKERSDNIRKLGLTSREKSDLVSFMKSLTSKDADTVVPILPR
ncbi:MAG: tryptophan tryptophylquinone biosynthesis enzyme MauG [Proteobacteria bacterium]|nr:tryptophan tryptophylquinone biosynthesis enzyme MauG [Pseudomonadota bacterium]